MALRLKIILQSSLGNQRILSIPVGNEDGDLGRAKRKLKAIYENQFGEVSDEEFEAILIKEEYEPS